MQDLGVCDELGCSDDFTMPDVDSTFKNIEELFGGEQELARALLDDNYTTCSSVEKDMSINKSDNGYERSVEVQIIFVWTHYQRILLTESEYRNSSDMEIVHLGLFPGNKIIKNTS